MTGSLTSKRTAFDTVVVSGYNSGEEAVSMVYQSKIDLDGSGIYVQPIVGHKAAATGASLTQDPATGDVYIGFSIESSLTQLGPGEPVGFIQNLSVQWITNSFTSRTTIAKLGKEVMPYCVASCGENGLVVGKDTCFIDNVCYRKDETGANIGIYCEICDPIQSQTEWSISDMGVSSCYIDGVCYTKGEFLRGATEMEPHAELECQFCWPEESTDSWSVKPGFELIDHPITQLPPRCISIDDDDDDDDYDVEDYQYDDDDDGIVEDNPYDYDDDDDVGIVEDYQYDDDDDDIVEDDDYDDDDLDSFYVNDPDYDDSKDGSFMEEEKKEEDKNVVNKNGLYVTIAFIAIVASLIVGAAIYLNDFGCFWKKVETGEHEFFPAEADFI